MIVSLVKLLVILAANLWGLVLAPYPTMRRISLHSSLFEAGLLWLAVLPVLSLVVLSKHGLRHPFLLSFNINYLFRVSMVSLLLVVVLIYFLGRLASKKADFLAVLVCWSYTLVPTMIWFALTAVLYVLLPPPRTGSLWGQLFSFFYLTASIVLLLWKGLLYYLVLRFSLRLNLKQIMTLSMVLLPTLAGYSYLLYKRGIFKVPFI